MKVGDLVVMRSFHDPNSPKLGIILGVRKTQRHSRSPLTDLKYDLEYQAAWFYTFAPNWGGARNVANWYFAHHLAKVEEVSDLTTS